MSSLYLNGHAKLKTFHIEGRRRVLSNLNPTLTDPVFQIGASSFCVPHALSHTKRTLSLQLGHTWYAPRAWEPGTAQGL